MSITIKKTVLENFIKKIVENRTPSYGDMTSTMFDSGMESEDLPTKPVEMMSSQLAVEAPPVDDAEYVPGTKGELGRAAQLIAAEVPEDQIEKFYRQLHRMLDNSLDSHQDKKMSDELLESFRRLIESYHDDDDPFGDKDDAAAQWLKQQGADDDDKEIDDEDIADDFGGGEITTGEYAQLISQQIKQQGDQNVQDIKDIEDMMKQFKDIVVVPANVDASKIIEPRLRAAERAAAIIVNEEEVPEELQSIVDAAKTWSFDNPETPHMDVVFVAMQAVYEVNYQLISANHSLTYGGSQIAPRETGFGKAMTITRKKPGSVGSVEYSAGIMKDISSKYGLVYNNAIRSRAIFNLTNDQIEAQIFKILKGLYEFNPTYQRNLDIYATHFKYNTNDANKEMAKLITMAYKYDIEEEGVNIDRIIHKYFSIHRATEYYTMRNFNFHAHQFADEIRKTYPPAIYALMEKSKYYTKDGNFKIQNPDIPELTVTMTKTELLEAITVFVDSTVAYAVDSHESAQKEKERIELEKQQQKLDDAESGETEKLIKTLEKQANPQRYTHIAPLYGFRGESGLRQWVLKFPERKLRLLQLSKNETDNHPGAKKFAEIASQVIEKVIQNLPVFLKIYNRQEQIDDLSKQFLKIKNEETKDNIDINNPEVIATQSEEFRNAINIANKDFEMIDEAYQELPLRDIALVSGAIEHNKDIPVFALTDWVRDSFNEEELTGIVEGYRSGIHGLGGIIARSILGDILDDVIQKTDKKWRVSIAEKLDAAYEDIDYKEAFSLAEHFMGKKNVPDFSSPNKKGTQKFLVLGVDENEFYKIYAESIGLYDKIISEYIPEKEADIKSLLNKVQQADLVSLQRMKDDEKSTAEQKRKKAIDAAFDIYPYVLVRGIKEYADVQHMEHQQKIASDEAERLKQELNEIRLISKLVEDML
tara:strand:+ start:6201 stop:8990 length:2790 start_codon:yes stop_codon:yes gene_type:complete